MPFPTLLSPGKSIVRRIVFSTMCCLLVAQYAPAQISQQLFMSMPDSLQPRNRARLKIHEAKKILRYTFLIDGWDKKEYEQTDSLCLLFAPKYVTIASKKEQREFLYQICQYLYDRKNFHSGKSSLRGAGTTYAYPFLKIAREYCAIYLDLYGHDAGENLGELSQVLLYKSTFEVEEDSFKDAYYTLQQALVIAKKSKSSKDIITKYTSLALLFEKLDLPEQTLVYSDSAETILKDIRVVDFRQSMKAYIIRLKQIANFTLYTRNFASQYADSITHLHQTAKVMTDAKLKGRLAAYSYVLVSGVTYFRGDYKATLANIDSAYSAFPNMRLMNGWEMAMVLKGLSLRKLGELSESNKVLQQLDLSDVRRPIIGMLLTELYTEEKTKNNYPKALNYLEQLNRFQQRKHMLTMQGKALEMEQFYHVRQRDQQILQLIQLQDRNQIIAFFIILVILLLVLILVLRYRVTLVKTNNLINQLDEATQLQVLHLEAAREEERRILGQDLHDGLSASIAAIRHHLEIVIVDIRDIPVKDSLENIYSQVTNAYDISRDKSHTWFKGEKKMREQSFATQIQTLADSALPKNYYTREISVDAGGLKNVSIEARITMLRIIQEALTNIVKHANARKVNILIYEEVDEVIVNVRDDGKGFSYDKLKNTGAGLGLSSIHERVQKMKGSLEINSDAGGTEVIVSFPI